MGNLTSRITWEPLRSRAASTFTGSYQTLGTPLANPSFICKLVNNTSVDVTISIDGTTDIDIAPAGSFWLYDESKYISSTGPCIAIPKGTQFYVKGNAGTGSIYLVTQYIVGS